MQVPLLFVVTHKLTSKELIKFVALSICTTVVEFVLTTDVIVKLQGMPQLQRRPNNHF